MDCAGSGCSGGYSSAVWLGFGARDQPTVIVPPEKGKVIAVDMLIILISLPIMSHKREFWSIDYWVDMGIYSMGKILGVGCQRNLFLIYILGLFGLFITEIFEKD